MATATGGSWYVAAKRTTYSVLGFILALIGGTLLAGGFDLGGQIAFAVMNGGTPEGVLSNIAAAAVDLQRIPDGQQIQLIGLAVHFGIIAVMTLVYLIAASRIAIVNSTPEISFLWYGLLIGAIMIWVVIPLRFPDQPPVLAPAEVIGQLVRHIFLVALPIATMAKAAARRD